MYEPVRFKEKTYRSLSAACKAAGVIKQSVSWRVNMIGETPEEALSHLATSGLKGAISANGRVRVNNRCYADVTHACRGEGVPVSAVKKIIERSPMSGGRRVSVSKAIAAVKAMRGKQGI